MSTKTKSVLTRNTELALKAPSGAPVPSEVWLPPAIRGRDVRVAHDVAVTREPPSIKENVARINSETDPIGLLTAIANGQPIATFEISEDGEVIVRYETLELKDRLKVIFHLADKILPRMTMSVQKHKKSSEDPHSWDAALERAANQG
jgi:hypothetical protein